ncbi:hypothetical protein [Mucilaginibacter sp.]|uniref:hypothetical protein n=1 Tax=Mucilaginibacter sp. TaxID=1882438 RepID=UPI000CBB3838|nr:hypothetical protein [Mucilaginibacter sp.]PLW90975.1 MAG: hypothetical protein C0154_03635 [Mucilaginibacter sp.]PMP66324.1 MAG: hypothetical protein C0191_00595 [Mucilaginibacter sp.]HEK21334.1 hypothetical protein [Bacteroidota bacterium]
MISAPGDLKEVVINGRSESLVEKAIRKIPENYPSHSFIMTGHLRMLHTTRDTVGYHYYYRNDAMVEPFYPGYSGKKGRPQIKLLHKSDTLIDDLTQDPIKWVNGYTSILRRDFVLNRLEVLDKDRLKRYRFVLNGKERISDRQTDVINFFTLSDEKNAGIIFIDTATFAIARMALTKYNVKPLVGIETDKGNTLVDYHYSNSKWYLDAVKINNISHHKKLQLYRTTDFKAATFDTTNLKTIAYNDEIPNFSEDINVKIPATRANDLPSDTQLSRTSDSLFSTPDVPLILKTDKKNMGSLIYRAYVSYMLGNNIRTIFAISKLPLNFNSYQPLLSKNLSLAGSYILGLNLQFRLYKGLFSEFDTQFNMGIGGVNTREDAYYLLYELEINKRSHILSISPLFWYSEIGLSKNKVSYYAQRSWVSGLIISYDISHRLTLFGTLKYYSTFKTLNNNNFLLNPEPLTYGAGLKYRLKL